LSEERKHLSADALFGLLRNTFAKAISGKEFAFSEG
jgi:hypothetical protein